MAKGFFSIAAMFTILSFPLCVWILGCAISVVLLVIRPNIVQMVYYKQGGIMMCIIITYYLVLYYVILNADAKLAAVIANDVLYRYIIYTYISISSNYITYKRIK